MSKIVNSRGIVRCISIILCIAMTVGFSGCATKTAPSENVSQEVSQQAEDNASTSAYDWIEAADVIVVGGGGAGFSAALEAGNAGASVIILEKAGICGGNTLLSGGMILAGGTDLQKEMGITDTRESFTAQQMEYHSTAGDLEMVREMSMASPEEFEFMRSLRRKYETISLMPPAWDYDTDETWAPRTHWDATDHNGHFLTLQGAADKLDNVHYYTDSEVVSLIVNEQNEVIGVETIHGDLYRANKGVVIATGSFDNNAEMSLQYNPMNYWALEYEKKYNYGKNLQSANNTGDGIRMAQEIGADLQLSNANCIADLIWFGGAGAPLYGTILVNSNAKRFVQESAHWGYLNSMVYQEAVQTNKLDADSIHFWGITDQVAVDNNIYIKGLVNDLGITAKPGFSELIIKADTIEELAQKVGLPVENLTYTVDRWNGMCDNGEDSDFNRKDVGKEVHLYKLEQGPFYAIPYIPFSMGSFGGLKTNSDAQVMNVNGEAIPRLYAAGSVMSGMYTGQFYGSCGWSILGTVHWGRKAGKNVSELDSWTTEAVAAKEQDQTQAQTQSGNYNAGDYSATVKGHNGDIIITVKFSDTAITNITVGENSESEGIGTVAIDKLTESVLTGQTADIDSISGATVTSQAFLNGVKDCISQASK